MQITSVWIEIYVDANPLQNIMNKKFIKNKKTLTVFIHECTLFKFLQTRFQKYLSSIYPKTVSVASWGWLLKNLPKSPQRPVQDSAQKIESLSNKVCQDLGLECSICSAQGSKFTNFREAHNFYQKTLKEARELNERVNQIDAKQNFLDLFNPNKAYREDAAQQLIFDTTNPLLAAFKDKKLKEHFPFNNFDELVATTLTDCLSFVQAHIGVLFVSAAIGTLFCWIAAKFEKEVAVEMGKYSHLNKEKVFLTDSLENSEAAIRAALSALEREKIYIARDKLNTFQELSSLLLRTEILKLTYRTATHTAPSEIFVIRSKKTNELTWSKYRVGSLRWYVYSTTVGCVNIVLFSIPWAILITTIYSLTYLLYAVFKCRHRSYDRPLPRKIVSDS